MGTVADSVALDHTVRRLDFEQVQIHIISFEGVDPYSCAGGIASRLNGLARALADLGGATHLWFVGDPELPGHELCEGLWLHRWCQWISRYHPAGVYDGEEQKRADFSASLPPFLVKEILLPHLMAGGRSVILAEEWHTADAVLHLDGLLRMAGVREQVEILWNANNTFGFHRINWERLAAAATITTVSRYMKHMMWSLGVDPLVIPNGLAADAFEAPDREAVRVLQQRLRGRTAVSKVARWDPDKRWLMAIGIVGELKRDGRRPLLIARGGVEAHVGEVLAAAARGGLRVEQRRCVDHGVRGLLAVLENCDNVDVVSLASPLDAATCRVLFRSSNAVLANSGHEPFGLVGLEGMAVGALTCTGCTGEDYAVGGWNALVLQTADPREFVGLFAQLMTHRDEERALRRHARSTARQYAWPAVIRRNLLPQLALQRA